MSVRINESTSQVSIGNSWFQNIKIVNSHGKNFIRVE